MEQAIMQKVKFASFLRYISFSCLCCKLCHNECLKETPKADNSVVIIQVFPMSSTTPFNQFVPVKESLNLHSSSIFSSLHCSLLFVRSTTVQETDKTHSFREEAHFCLDYQFIVLAMSGIYSTNWEKNHF